MLEYPSELRAEEFPVFGYAGRNALQAKMADYILFSDKLFNDHRGNTIEDKSWVRRHGLLVVEAKRPGELTNEMGQPEFYSGWIRSVAYLMIDGIRIVGYYHNAASPDKEIINCLVSELPDHEEILHFSFTNIMAAKNQAITKLNNTTPIKNLSECEHLDYNELKIDDELNLPDETIDYMRSCLGKNADGLGNLQVTSRYLNMTDSYLQNKMRYDIPEYMFDIPRNWTEACLCINETVVPFIKGDLLYFYWEDYERYYFVSTNIEILVMYKGGEQYYFDIAISALDRRVSDRISVFRRMKRCLKADTIRISCANKTQSDILLQTRKSGKLWPRKSYVLNLVDIWVESLEKLEAIESYYEIKFDLKRISDKNELAEFYDSVDMVYNGLMMKANCSIEIRGGFADENITIVEPELFEEKEDIPLPTRDLHGITFKACRSWLLPGTINCKGSSSDDLFYIDACCYYRIESMRNNSSHL